MDFAKKLMEKYGWKEGEGLGKNNTGINKALRANLKFDTAGLGVDQAADFNNHWWERVFNEAANNIDVITDGDKISMNIKDENSVEITTKEYSLKKLKKTKCQNQSYNNFLKTATLTNLGNEETDNNEINVEDIQMTVFKPLTDEELFAACGGRTAHKGARHGLKLSGKLSRIEEQEKILLAQIENNLRKEETNEWKLVKDKKKKKIKKSKSDNLIGNPEDSEKLLNEINYNTEYRIKSKKKKKQQKQLDNILSNSLDLISIEKRNVNVEILEVTKNPKNDKKKKTKNIESEEWCTYRNSESVEEVQQIKNLLHLSSEEQEIQSSETPKTLKCDNLHPSLITNEKIKRKHQSESKRNAKKLKKTLKNITEILDNSMDIGKNNNDILL